MWNTYAYVFIVLIVAQVFVGLNWYAEYKRKSDDKMFSMVDNFSSNIKTTEIFYIDQKGTFHWGYDVNKDEAAAAFAKMINMQLPKTKGE
jgi:uncharacterized protein (DUF486 family)